MIRHIRDLDAGTAQADVCVIGSGAAGLTVALEFEGTPLRVIVLEGGESRLDPASQDLYRAHSAGLDHGGINDARFRVFGGTTTRWAGQVLPLFDIDFERRDWLPRSGWPLTRDELEPYYSRASEVLGVPRLPRDPLLEWPDGLLPRVDFDTHLVEPFVSTYSPHPDFARAFRRLLDTSANVEVILGANVVEVVPDRAVSHVEHVAVQAFSGQKLDVRADYFVLCCGGIESVRILLASSRHCEGGLGNDRDLVGRCFQDHPGLLVGRIRDPDDAGLAARFLPRRVDGVRYRPARFRSADELQRREKLLHCCGEVFFSFADSVEAGGRLFTALRRRERPTDLKADLRAIAMDPAPLLREAARLATGSAADVPPVQYLAVGCEQAPNPRSRLYLSHDRDHLGMRRLALDWRLTHAEVVSIRRFAEVAADELMRLGVGRVDLDEFALPEDPDELSGVVSDFAHHMGAIRMAESAEEGVVDSQCMVFGIENLYVGSAAVFPTAGFSNPTFTLMALCIRIADAIRQRSDRL
jgi:choline dehydrogenase-like flavoprotein